MASVPRTLGGTTSLLVLAIATGSLVGGASPGLAQTATQWIDPVLLVLMFLLLFELPLGGVLRGATNVRFIALAWTLNFLVIPFVGFAVASLFLGAEPLFFLGLMIYFVAPCTDWYLGFTRLVGGNVALGAALLPINMATQLLLFPVYMTVFGSGNVHPVELTALVEWFFQPLAAAMAARLLLHRIVDRLLPVCSAAIPAVLALLVALIFAANVDSLPAHLTIVPQVLLAVFCFFSVTFVLSEWAARVVRLDFPEHSLLSFTTGARNAPLMLGLATVAYPDQPLIYTAITIGMLIEFPHLAAMKWVFLNRRKRGPSRRSVQLEWQKGRP
ncbi:MAG: arsenic resistance protein [Pseudomonadota bacterium]